MREPLCGPVVGSALLWVGGRGARLHAWLATPRLGSPTAGMACMAGAGGFGICKERFKEESRDW